MGVVFGFSVVVGVASGVYGDLTAFLLLVGCVLALAGIVPRSLRLMTLTAAFGLIVGMVAAQINGSTTDDASPSIVPMEIEGVIRSDPRLTLTGSYADLVWTDADGLRRQSLIFLPASSEAGRSDRVHVLAGTGLVSDPIFAERVVVLSTPGRVEMLRRAIRKRTTSRILRVAPGSNGSLALGLLIGDDSGLTPFEREHLRASGLSHITAVSGSNVAMLIVVVAFLLRALVGRSWLWVALQLAAIVFYVWIVGAEPPIIRAAIMGSLALVSIRLGRPAHLFTLLFLSAGGMAAHEPEVLSSLSFQLSFLAMLALGVAGLHILRLEGRTRQVVAILVSPVAAAIATAPLIAFRFGFFGLGTVPANVLVAPVIAPATALSALTGILAGIPIVGGVAGGALWLATGLVLEVAHRVGGFSAIHWTFAPLEVGTTILIYLLIAACATPLVPEARLAAHRIGEWASGQPAAAFSSAFASLALLWVLLSMSN